MLTIYFTYIYIYTHVHTSISTCLYLYKKREGILQIPSELYFWQRTIFGSVIHRGTRRAVSTLCTGIRGKTQKPSEAECTGSPELSVAQRGVLRPDVVGHMHNDQRSSGKRPCSVNAGWELEVTLPVCTIRSSWLGLWPSRKEGPLECRRWNQLVFYCCFQSDMMKQLSVVPKWRINQPPPHLLTQRRN